VAGATLLNAVATGLSQVGVYRYGLRVRDTHVGGAGVAVSDQDVVQVIAQTPSNHIPHADAGGPYNFTPLVQSQLNGSGSGDADVGDTLTYQWTQVGGTRTALDDATVVNPTVTFFAAGVYRYQLVVTDAVGNASIPSIATVVVGFPGNNPPVANAGADQIGSTGVPVLLDGSLSTDVDLETLSYFWRQTRGTQLLLSDRRNVNPSFTPSRAGTYSFELVVEDGNHFSPPATVTVSVDPPVAHAGPDQNLFLGSGGTALTVTLDGSGSFDPTPGPQALSFSWTQVAGPSVTLSNPNIAGPTFQTLVPGTYQFVLVVDDGLARSAQLNLNNGSDAFVKIIVSQASDTIPTANAGPDQFVDAGSVVQLDGSGSFDADGDNVSYLWTQVTGVPVILTPSALVVNPRFIPSVGGTAYTFRLTASDPGGKQATDTVTIFATGGQTGSGAGNPLPTADPAATGSTFAQSGGGGGCDARPAWVRGDVQDHWALVLLNLMMFLLPLISLIEYRQRVVVATPRRTSVRLVRRD
jgi:PKD repeat protein